MTLRSKSYIFRGAIAGFLSGNVIARHYFSSFEPDIKYFADPTPQNIIIVLTCVGIGAFVGHILRHQKADQMDLNSSNDKEN